MEFIKITTYSPYGDERYNYLVTPKETPDVEIEAIADDYLEEDVVYFWSISSAAIDYKDNFDLFQKECNYWIEFLDENTFCEEACN